MSHRKKLFRPKWTDKIHEEWIGNLLEERTDIKPKSLVFHLNPNPNRYKPGSEIDANLTNFIGFQNSLKAPDMRVASVERTLIDVLDRPEYSGGISDIPEIFRRASARASVQKIIDLLPSYRSKSLVQRVGYMLEAVGYKVTHEQEQELQTWCAGNVAYLFTPGHSGTNNRSRYSSNWRLVINAPGFLSGGNSE